jgi:phosphotriesterase-related protein
MLRRDFLKTTALAAFAPEEGKLMTVRGPLAPADAGLFLAHEHLFSQFGEEPADQAVYDEPALLAVVIPYVTRLKGQGLRTLADATAQRFGRHPLLLKTISERTGLHVLTNTGYYGAANKRYIPASASEEPAVRIAARWLAEWRDGIGATGVRPGFIKLGFDAGPLQAIDRKLVAAAAALHRESGLTIAAHTGDNPAAALEQLRILREEGVKGEAWIWVHANACKDEAALSAAAAQGAWLSFDGLAPDSLDRHLHLVRLMDSQRRLGQVLLSHDGNSFRGGVFRKPYDALFNGFLPRLKEAGLPERQLTVLNPATAFTIRRRT